MLFRDLKSKRMVKFKDTRPAQSGTQHGASELPAATWRFGVHDSDWRFAWHDAVAATWHHIHMSKASAPGYPVRHSRGGAPYAVCLPQCTVAVETRESRVEKGKRCRWMEAPTQPRPATFVFVATTTLHFSSSQHTLTTHSSSNIIVQHTACRRSNERLCPLRRASCPSTDQRRSARQPRDRRRLCGRSACKARQRCQGVSCSLQTHPVDL
jgi:hypothetical protein